MNKRWLLLIALLVAGAAMVFIAVRAARTPKPGSTLASSARKKGKRIARARPAHATHWEPYSPLVHAPDPRGSLRLEGQVVDAQDHGVDKATVRINSSPPRTTVTEQDGSFAFKNLIARQYKLRARAGNLVGGPIKLQLAAKSDPVIIRVRAGITLEVSVVGAKGHQPIAKATVSVDQRQLQADGAGKAVFEGVASGWVVIAARASGYGTTQQLFEVPEGQRHVATKIALSRGAALAGVVKDSKGQPVAGASVRALDMSRLVQPSSSPLTFVKTDDRGRFTISGVSAGTYRLVAHKAGFPAAQSAPIAVDGARDRGGVVITLEAGATFAGRVLHDDGSPAAAATVKVAPESGSFGAAVRFRRTVTDQRGAFKLDGLPRRKLEALAYAARASSESQPIDLRKGDVSGATLRLTVNGTIAGTVVDGKGQPVAEAQVTASGDFWGGAKMVDLKLRGSAQVMTDGGGNFRFSGLASGKYRLRASRSARRANRFGPGAVAAKTGDTAVKIVVRDDGGVKGAVRFADGRPATAYRVNVGYPPPRPVISESGAFAISSLRPGKYDVTFVSASFADKTVRDVEITPGKVTDMGSITVNAGRSISGRVLDAKGKPVANAAVVLGSRIVGDGASLVLDLGGSVDLGMKLRRGASTDDGTFVIKAVGPGAYVIAAEHAEHGRSEPVAVPASTRDSTAELRLRPFGRVDGVVKLGSAPGTNLVVIASAGSSKQVVVTRSGDDGRYTFERLPAGDHTLTAMSGRGASTSTGSKKVTVVAGKALHADITIEVGEIDLSVTIVAKTGKIDATQVFLFSGDVKVSSGGEINRVFLAAAKKGGAKMAFATGGNKARFTKIRAGRYSVCSVPITGNMNDPIFAKRLQAHAEKLKVYCQAHQIAKTPPAQTLTLTLPAMEPLPAK